MRLHYFICICLKRRPGYTQNMAAESWLMISNFGKCPDCHKFGLADQKDFGTRLTSSVKQLWKRMVRKSIKGFTWIWQHFGTGCCWMQAVILLNWILGDLTVEAIHFSFPGDFSSTIHSCSLLIWDIYIRKLKPVISCSSWLLVCSFHAALNAVLPCRVFSHGCSQHRALCAISGDRVQTAVLQHCLPQSVYLLGWNCHLH